jgi:hypothetical protein
LRHENCVTANTTWRMPWQRKIKIFQEPLPARDHAEKFDLIAFVERALGPFVAVQGGAVVLNQNCLAR